MKKKPFSIMMIILFSIPLFLPSCITEKEIYQSARGEKELPKWRLLARAREEYAPYVQWKKTLIEELIAGSQIVYTKMGPVEYTINGESGPYLIIMHGGPGGYDQTAALFSDMFGKGGSLTIMKKIGVPSITALIHSITSFFRSDIFTFYKRKSFIAHPRKPLFQFAFSCI